MWRELVGFPSASAASWCKLGARGGVSTLQWPHPWPLGACGWVQGIRDTGAFYPEHNFFAGQQNQKPDVAGWTSERGFPATINRHPYCLVTHVREAALSGVGVQTPGWDFTVLLAVPAFWPPPCREEGGGCRWQGAHFSAQNISCLSSGRLCTLAPNFQPERDVLG